MEARRAIWIARVAVEDELNLGATTSNNISFTDGTQRDSAWIGLLTAADLRDLGLNVVCRTVAYRLGAEAGHADTDTTVGTVGNNLRVTPIAVGIKAASSVTNIGP